MPRPQEVSEHLDAFLETKGYHSFEMDRGVQRFEDTIRQIGYSSTHEFLRDNSGAIEAMLEFIGRQRNDEWAEGFLAAIGFEPRHSGPDGADLANILRDSIRGH